MKNLIDDLKNLRDTHNVVGIKQSFEDEGVLIDDVILMRRIADAANLYLSVKIGGCEAISDINNCVRIGVDNIVAPMIESEFALQKFIESVANIQNIKFYVNLESKSAYNNLDNILGSPSSKLLEGVVVGRSDLTKSYGYGKEYVDSPEMQYIVHNIMDTAKKYKFKTLMGGNMSPKSVDFVEQLYTNDLLEYIETRNIIIKLNKNNINSLNETIKSVLLFESKWLDYKADYYNNIGHSYKTRSKTIIDRL